MSEMAPPSTQQCPQCGAEIVWCQNDRTLKLLPINFAVDPDGDVLTYRRGEKRTKFFRVIEEKERRGYQAAGTKLHTRHTCATEKK